MQMFNGNKREKTKQIMTRKQKASEFKTKLARKVNFSKVGKVQRDISSIWFSSLFAKTDFLPDSTFYGSSRAFIKFPILPFKIFHF